MSFKIDRNCCNSGGNPFEPFKGKPVGWEEAVSVLLKIESVVSELGAHTALTGSCIYTGKSDDDIDIIIYPHQTDNPPSKHTLLNALHAAGLLGSVDENGYWYLQTNPEYVDKDVVITNVDGYRVDLFFFLHLS